MKAEAWKKFFGDGWTVDTIPGRVECFEAGWEAAIRSINTLRDNQGWIVENHDQDACEVCTEIKGTKNVSNHSKDEECFI
jgi:hypothetical protein